MQEKTPDTELEPTDRSIIDLGKTVVGETALVAPATFNNEGEPLPDVTDELVEFGRTHTTIVRNKLSR